MVCEFCLGTAIWWEVWGRTAAFLSLEECSLFLLVTIVLSTDHVQGLFLNKMPDLLEAEKRLFLNLNVFWEPERMHPRLVLSVLSKQAGISGRPHKILSKSTWPLGVKKFSYHAGFDLLVPASGLEPWLPVFLISYGIRQALTTEFHRGTVAEARSQSLHTGFGVNWTEGRQPGKGCCLSSPHSKSLLSHSWLTEMKRFIKTRWVFQCTKIKLH